MNGPRTPHSHRRRTTKRRGLLVAAGITGVLVLVGAAGFLAVGEPPLAPQSSPVRLVPAPGISTGHGPWFTADGRAAGFSHDELGAAIAASQLTARVSPAADPAVAARTVNEQCWGDLPTALRALRAIQPGPDQPETAQPTTTAPTALLYRVIAGYPTGDHVVVSLLADTPQAREQGGLARVDATLRWWREDWQLRVPLPAASLQDDPAHYTPLAGVS